METAFSKENTGETLKELKPILYEYEKYKFVCWWLTVLVFGSVLWPVGLGGTLFLKYENIFNSEHCIHKYYFHKEVKLFVYNGCKILSPIQS